MYRLLGFSSNELTCEFCNAESILDSELRAVNDSIANASNYAHMIGRAEEYMLKKLNRIKRDQTSH